MSSGGSVRNELLPPRWFFEAVHVALVGSTMTMKIPPVTIKRLAFAKYLFLVGVEQSKSSDLQAAAAILAFHDSIEFFLQVASEYLEADVGKKPSFLDYWKILESKLNGERVPQQGPMRRLNDARISLKHKGNLPSKIIVDEFRVLTAEFFEEASQILFNLNFSDISLIEYVGIEAVRRDLHRAEALANNKDYNKAAEILAIAFQRLMDEGLKQSSNPFFLNPLLRKANPAHLLQRSSAQSSDDIGFIKFANGMEEAIDEVRDEFRVLAAGINYRKYARFRGSTPRVIRQAGGDYIPQSVKFNGYIEPCQEFIDFGVHFVIDCSIRMESSLTSLID